MPVPARSHNLWVLDFSAELDSCRRFRILAIYDVRTRRRLAALPEFSPSSTRVARELDLLIARQGRPKIGGDIGADLTSSVIPTRKSIGTTSILAIRRA